MGNLSWFIVVVFIVAVILSSIIRIPKQINPQVEYSSKKLLSVSEKRFLDLLTPLTKYGLIIVPQVNLASVIQKNGNARYQNELFRNVDFGIFDKDFNVRLLIELNDATHGQKKRQYRDIKVRQITKNAGIPLITFYTNKPNKQEYVLHRISEVLNEGDHNDDQRDLKTEIIKKGYKK
ncbi:DUF2726 domain-containing protein [Candidatus Saccharibacteria bacterium]|nr:DUF2726 domain-containing protein [Candidatus Saccharibacteria bacterium]